jgi:hypothetical protein
MTWTCPQCDRTFGSRRAHVCTPGRPVEYWLAERPDGQREAASAIVELARAINGVTVEAVDIGVLIKRERSIVELRTKVKWLQLSVIARRPLPNTARARVTRVARWGAHMTAYFVRLTVGAEIDRAMRAWLRGALAATPIARPRSHSRK